MSGIAGGARLNAPPAEDTVNDQRACRYRLRRDRHRGGPFRMRSWMSRAPYGSQTSDTDRAAAEKPRPEPDRRSRISWP